MMKKASLLWLDLEMTGLDVSRDRILEVGAIATNWKLDEIARFESVVRVSPRLLRRRMTGEFWDANATTRDALVEQNHNGKSARIVESELVKFIGQNFNKKKPVYLAGNSIWNDRKFIEREWPNLDKKLHYRMLDVSAWKIVFENMYGEKFIKPEDHRAMSDIEGSIMELRQYLAKVKK